MKRYLGPLAVLTALAVLTGCGDDPDGRADDPATQQQTDAAAPEVVDIVSGSAVGRAEVAETATVIRDDDALNQYLRQFESSPFVADLTYAMDAAAPAADRALGLAVIEVSCNEPPSATVTEEGGRFFVTAGKVVDPHMECIVPVTSVAVLDLPAQ